MKKIIELMIVFLILSGMTVAQELNSTELINALKFCVEKSGGQMIKETVDGNDVMKCKLIDGTICDAYQHMIGLCPGTNMTPLNQSEPITTTLLLSSTTITQTVKKTTTSIIPKLPTEPIKNTTAAAPVCGNKIKEIGEECDTSPNGCGTGNFKCNKCKCVEIKNIMPSTTIKTSADIVENPEDNTTNYLIVVGLFVALVVFVIIASWIAGKQDE